MSIIIKTSRTHNLQQDIKSSEITSESAYLNRRDFIKQSGILAGAAWAGGLVAGGLSMPALAADSEYGDDFKGLIKTPYGKGESLTSFKNATTYNNFYEFGTVKKTRRRMRSNLLPTPGQLPLKARPTRLVRSI